MKMDSQSGTNSPSPGVTLPRLTPDERQGLQDYWRAYDTHRAEITAHVLEMAGQHPEFKYILQNAASQPSAEEQARNQEIQRNAILNNDWEPYLKSLRQQGMNYARGGLSFQAWFELIGAFRKVAMPYLV